MRATATDGPVVISWVRFSLGHFFGCINTFKHYAGGLSAGGSLGGSPSSPSSPSSGSGGSSGRSPVLSMYSKPGELRSLAVLLAPSVSKAAESSWGVRGLCALIDSAPEPIGLKTDEALAEVPKVVLCCAGER